MGALVGTGYNGNWYYIVGSVDAVNAELNRVNAKPQNVVSGQFDFTVKSIIIFVGRP